MRYVLISVVALMAPLLCPAVSHADDGCGVGMYWDPQTQDCEVWATGAYVDPVIVVPVPYWGTSPRRLDSPCVDPTPRIGRR